MSLQTAIEEALNILGIPYEHNELDKLTNPETAEALNYERHEAIDVLRAAIGLPISRQKCKHCGAIDSIWWQKSDGNGPEGSELFHPMKCHSCNRWVTKEDYEWVESTESNPDNIFSLRDQRETN